MDTSKVIVALDNYSPYMAREIIAKYSQQVYGFKMNHTLYPYIGKEYNNVFCDYKLYDIPSTVCNVIEHLIDSGAEMVTVNMNNNIAVFEAIEQYSDKIKLLGVTALTSWDHNDPNSIHRQEIGNMYDRTTWIMKKYNFWGMICSPRDLKLLNNLVNNDPELKSFADTLLDISKREIWVEPDQFWDAGSILKDINSIDQTISRKEYLAEFIENVDVMFSDANLNKIEALYGPKHVEALKDIIRRMKSGSNRPPGTGDRLTTAWLNWVNNSVGTIMFFNRRSALLQMISFANFTNWSDNNPLMAATAFANQPALLNQQGF